MHKTRLLACALLAILSSSSSLGSLGSLDSFAASLTQEVSGTDLRNGKAVKHSLKNSPYTVVAFLSVNCPCSRHHEKILAEIQKEFESPKLNRFSFIGIHSNANEDQDLSKKHFSDAGLPFPVIQDENAKMADALGAYKTPHVYIIDSKGEILYQGGVDDTKTGKPTKHYLKEALTELRDGKKITQNNVRVLGCEIKRP